MKLHFQFELDKNQRQRWVQCWQNSRHAYPRQHYVFGEIERAKGRTPIYVYGEEDGTIVCLGIFSIRPLFFGNRFSLEAYSLRGPVFDDIAHGRELLSQIISWFKALKVGRIRVGPLWQFPEAKAVESLLNELGFMPHRQDYGTRWQTGLIDLCPSEDEILASFSKSARREVRRAQRQGIVVRPATSMGEAELFFRNLNDMHKSRGFIHIPTSEYRIMFKEVFQPHELGVVLNAFCDNTFVAGLMLIRGPDAAYGCRFVIAPEILRRLSNLRVAPIVWWFGMLWAKERGSSWLNLEGYSSTTDRSSKEYRVHAYKHTFKPEPVVFIGEHVYVCNSFMNTVFLAHKRGLLRFGRLTRSLPYQVKTRLDIRKARKEQTQENKS